MGVSTIFRRLRAFREFLRLASERPDANGRSATSQLRELLRLKRATGVSAEEYFMYGFAKPDMPYEAKLQYLTRALHERYLAPLDPPQYSALISDKYLFKDFFGRRGFAVPKTYGVFHPLSGRDEQGGPLRTRDDLARLLRALPRAGIVTKPVIGGCGAQVMVFSGCAEDDATELIHVNGERFPLERLYAAIGPDAGIRSPGYLIEAKVAQHPFLDAFNPSTLHTTRIVTLRAADNSVHVLGAALKIGLDDSGVESLTDRHIGAPVDIRTGELGKAALWNGAECARIDTHPKTGIRIAGARLPMWDRMRDIAVAAAGAARGARSLGWDIGLSPDGPVLIEANEIWGEEILQVALGRGIWTPELRALLGAPAGLS